MSCTPTDEEFTFDESVNLTFSADTVIFDTVFTSVGSITKRLKVYNRNKNAIRISSIDLAKSSSSPYTLTVNGVESDSFDGEEILGEDSLLVLVKVFIDPKNETLPFLVKDSIVFNTNNNVQDVKLVSWGQDAHFLNDSILACDATWGKGKPYVIFNSVLVDTLCTLDVEAGTRIFLATGSSMFIKGTLTVDGQPDDRVLFRNDRLDEGFEHAPGQWGGLVFLEGSKDNRISFADIRNGTLGVRLGTPDPDTVADLTLENVLIQNMSNTGILCFNSDLVATNTLVNNCAQQTVGNFAGGNYTYQFCTFANFSFDFFRQDPSIIFTNNLLLADNTALVNDMKVTMTNSIVWGSLREELSLNAVSGATFELGIDHSILRTEVSDLDINNNVLNTDPEFFDAFNFDYHLDTLSPAKDVGVDIPLIINDLDGVARDNNPDIGAYERIE